MKTRLTSIIIKETYIKGSRNYFSHIGLSKIKKGGVMQCGKALRKQTLSCVLNGSINWCNLEGQLVVIT